MPCGLDHIVGATDEPEVAVAVPPRQVSREIPAVHEGGAIARVVSEVTAEHGGPARPNRELSDYLRGVDHFDAAVGATAHDLSVYARKRQAHRPGTHLARGIVRHHDGARFRLPPGVVKGQAEGPHAPNDGFGVERLTHARHEAQLRVRTSTGERGP